MQEVVIYFFGNEGVPVVTGVLRHELADEGGASRDLACGPLREEAQVAHGLLDLVLSPLIEHHILFTKRDQTLGIANALITVQNLPNVQLLVARGVFRLLLLRRDCLGLLLLLRFA